MATVLLTAEQAAARLGMCERTLRRLRQRGEIGYVAVTESRYRYTEEDCEAYIESRRRREEPPRSTKVAQRRISSTAMSATTTEGFMARRAREKAARQSAKR